MYLLCTQHSNAFSFLFVFVVRHCPPNDHPLKNELFLRLKINKFNPALINLILLKVMKSPRKIAPSFWNLWLIPRMRMASSPTLHSLTNCAESKFFKQP